MQFELAALGEWTPEKEMPVTAEAITAYAEATNDDAPDSVAGRIAPPVFAIVPVWDQLQAAAEAVAPEEARPRVVHGDQDMIISAPIEAGMTVSSKAAAIGVHVKDSGTTVVLKTETRDQDGRLLNEQYCTEFYRGVSGGAGSGEAAPDHRMAEDVAASEPAKEITYAIDEDQTYRYAKASLDDHEIHLDPEVATAAGLPGIIVHGLCLMAFAGRAALESQGKNDPALVRRIAVRFSRPMAPGDSLTTRIREGGAGGEVLFDCVNAAGDVALKDGVVELGAAS